jgi:hypothetical protein
MYWMAAWGSLSRPWRGPLVGYWSSSGAPVICAAPLTLFQVPPYVLGWRHGVPCRSPGMAAWGSLSQPWDGAGIRDAVAPVEGCSAGAKGDHSLKASQGWRVAEKYRLGR